MERQPKKNLIPGVLLAAVLGGIGAVAIFFITKSGNVSSDEESPVSVRADENSSGSRLAETSPTLTNRTQQSPPVQASATSTRSNPEQTAPTNATSTDPVIQPSPVATQDGNSISPLRSGLLAYYPLDETGGTKVSDFSGNEHHAVIQGNPNWTEGKIGGALRFDGQTIINAGDLANFERTDSYSYGAWVYPEDQKYMAIMGRVDDTGDKRGHDLFLSRRRVNVHLVNSGTSSKNVVLTTEQLVMNQWHHIMMTYDGSSTIRGINMYVDGVPQRMSTFADGLDGTMKTSVDFLIGRNTVKAPFYGMIDEVRIYDRELSPEEVAQLARDDSQTDIASTEPENKPEVVAKIASSKAADPGLISLVDDHIGWAGGTNKNNLYQFEVKSPGVIRTLRFWVDFPGAALDSYGDVRMTTPDGQISVIHKWSETNLQNFPGEVKSYQDLKSIDVDVSRYVSSSGRYSVEFLHRTGGQGIDIYRVQLDLETPVAMQRAKLPTAAQQKDAEEKLFEILKAEYAALKKNASWEIRRDLIDKLEAVAEDAQSDVITRYVVWQQIMKLSQEVAAYEVALKAADHIEQNFELDGYALKAEYLKDCLSNTRDLALAHGMAQRAIVLASDATQMDAFTGALDLLKFASLAASKSKDRSLSRTISSIRGKVLDQEKAFKSAEAARERLKDAPDDAKANEDLGMYLCVFKNRWSEGLPYLAKVRDADLKNAAELDLNSTTSDDPKVLTRTADAWWDFGEDARGEEQQAFLDRAAEWYRKAYPQLSSLPKAQVESRLRELNKLVAESRMKPGLLMTLYARHESQDKASGFVYSDELGLPLGPSMVIGQISPWKYDENLNAYVVGYLRIDTPGEYAIRSSSSYERDVLSVNGVMIDEYTARNHITRVHLDIGMVPIISVGTIGAKGSVDISWQSPGADDLGPIPSNVLYHRTD